MQGQMPEIFQPTQVTSTFGREACLDLAGREDSESSFQSTGREQAPGFPKFLIFLGFRRGTRMFRSTQSFGHAGSVRAVIADGTD